MKAELDSKIVLRRSPDVLETTVNDEPVLLHSTRWQYLHFTGSGAAIWQALAEPMSFEALIAALRMRFDIDEDTCRRETEQFLQKLLDEEFVIAT